MAQTLENYEICVKDVGSIDQLYCFELLEQFHNLENYEDFEIWKVLNSLKFLIVFFSSCNVLTF